MAQQTQIVPKFSFPYVETVINDGTVLTETVDVAEDSSVRYLFPFISEKGIDNTFVEKSSVESFEKTYGTSNFKKYGQPLMTALNVLKQDNTKVWCMRVMPENATYGNNVFSLFYRVDSAEDVTEASKRKFRIKFTQKSYDGITDRSMMNDKLDIYDGITTVDSRGNKSFIDGEGYYQCPFGYAVYMGRGTCGNNYRFRIGQNINYEKEYGIKMYNFEILTTTGGTVKEATYVGGIVTSSKYTTATLINDIIEDANVGDIPIDIFIDEDRIQLVYDAYIAFCKEQYPALQVEYATKLNEYNIPEGMLNGTQIITDEYRDKVIEIREIKSLINACKESELPDIDEFDPLFGFSVASSNQLPFIFYPETIDSDVDTEADDYVALDYTSNTNMPVFDATTGVVLEKGTNGYFDSPRQTNDAEGQVKQWTYDDEVEQCYINAFNAVYDKKILSPRRTPVNAFFDANYPYKVKSVMADLILLRNDCLLYLDTGIIESYSESNLNAMIEDYSIFDNCLISKNIQHYVVKESSTQKRNTVTITYFLASEYANHINTFGSHIPFVKGYCQLSGHVKNSLSPSIEDYEKELKETLYNNRFNYFETLDENVFQRGVQNTSQLISSDLSEESNVTVLYEIKRRIEKDIQAREYDFADSDVRMRFKTYEEAVYASWVGSKIESITIDFTANAWEAERAIVHAYLGIVFRGLDKRAIVEIDINKRTYTSTETSTE